MADISLIEPGLYQGAGLAHSQESNGSLTDIVPEPITAVVDLQQEHEDLIIPSPRMKSLLWFPIPDAEFPGVTWLDSVVTAVLALRAMGCDVLVHCAAGVSRSSLVTCAVLMDRHKIGCEEALAIVRKGRPVASPNSSFMEGLKKYEEYLAIQHQRAVEALTSPEPHRFINA